MLESFRIITNNPAVVEKNMQKMNIMMWMF